MDGGGRLSNPYHGTSGIPAIPDGDDDDDVLKYLVFSDPDYTEPLALPAPSMTESTIELSNAMPHVRDNLGQSTNEIPTISVNPRDQIVVLSTLEGHESGWHASSSHEGAPIEDGNPGASLWSGNVMDLGGWINEEQEPTFNDDRLHIDVEVGVHPIVLPLDANGIDCSGCRVLREVVHTNGLQNMKLTIHGGLLGCFYHALIEIEYNTDGTSPALERSYADLSELSFKCVKQFLTDYSLLRMGEGFYVVQDSLSDFLDTMCVPMSYKVPSTSNQELCLEESGSDQPEPTITDNNIATRIPKTGIAAQRARTGSLHIRDLAHCFHLPIVDAAKKLNLCATALKKICRRHGLDRWPHRKIKSINKKISKLQRNLLSGSGEGVARTQAEIERLKDRRTQIYIELSR